MSKLIPYSLFILLLLSCVSAGPFDAFTNLVPTTPPPSVVTPPVNTTPIIETLNVSDTFNCIGQYMVRTRNNLNNTNEYDVIGCTKNNTHGTDIFWVCNCTNDTTNMVVLERYDKVKAVYNVKLQYQFGDYRDVNYDHVKEYTKVGFEIKPIIITALDIKMIVIIVGALITMIAVIVLVFYLIFFRDADEEERKSKIDIVNPKRDIQKEIDDVLDEVKDQ